MVPPSDPLVPANLSDWFEKIAGVIGRSLVPLLVIQIGCAVISATYWVIMTQAVSGLPASGSSPADFSQALEVLRLSLLGMVVMMGVGVFAQGCIDLHSDSGCGR